jgi:C-terminal processing protease CtpA/Prc
MRAPWSWAVLGFWCAVPLAGQQLDPVQRAALAAGVWSSARYNSPAWDRVRADWDSAFAQMLAAAPLHQTDLAYFRRLRAFVALLRDGRATIQPPPAIAAQFARPPMAIHGVEGRPFLVDYVETDELRAARPERNAEIVAIQGVPAEEWVRDSILPETPGATAAARWERAIAHMLDGPIGTAVHLALRLPGGERRGASVTRTVALNVRWPLAPPPLRVDTLPDSVVWVRLSSFTDRAVARAFDRAFPRFDGVRAVILDLREHAGAGGGQEAGYAILGRLTTRPLITARRRTPQYRPTPQGEDPADSTARWVVAPPDTIPPREDLPAFTGTVVALTSSRTGGSAEDLLIAFRNAGRGPIIGERSAGTAGQVGEFPLWKAWRLRMSVTREELPDGTPIDGAGIAPEVQVEEKVGDFLSGRDAALERARAYLTEKSPPQ